jgi:hypothetical protein
MAIRLLKGLILGLVIGGLVAAVLVKGLGILTFAAAGAPVLAYAAALATGAVVGLVAGKPIWAKGAWIEALLKTFFGALLAAGGMALLRKFGHFDVDLVKLGLGSGSIGELPVLALPAIATVLSVFFEVDNTDSPEPAEKGRRVAGKAAPAKLRAPAATGAAGGEVDADDDVAAAKKAKK